MRKTQKTQKIKIEAQRNDKTQGRRQPSNPATLVGGPKTGAKPAPMSPRRRSRTTRKRNKKLQPTQTRRAQRPSPKDRARARGRMSARRKLRGEPRGGGPPDGGDRRESNRERNKARIGQNPHKDPHKKTQGTRTTWATRAHGENYIRFLCAIGSSCAGRWLLPPGMTA